MPILKNYGGRLFDLSFKLIYTYSKRVWFTFFLLNRVYFLSIGIEHGTPGFLTHTHPNQPTN